MGNLLYPSMTTSVPYILTPEKSDGQFIILLLFIP